MTFLKKVPWSSCLSNRTFDRSN